MFPRRSGEKRKRGGVCQEKLLTYRFLFGLCQHPPKGVVLGVLKVFWYMKPTKQHPLGGPSVYVVSVMVSGCSFSVSGRSFRCFHASVLRGSHFDVFCRFQMISNPF